MNKPDIDYPCDWPYRVIGANDEALPASIREALVDVEFRMREGNRSSAGKYASFEIVAAVRDERQRYWIYNRLRSLTLVKVVL